MYEVKWDGYRALGYVRNGEAKLVSRNGNDLTARFPEVAKALGRAMKSPDGVVDGEVCALDEQGLQAMHRRKTGALIRAVYNRATNPLLSSRRTAIRIVSSVPAVQFVPTFNKFKHSMERGSRVVSQSPNCYVE